MAKLLRDDKKDNQTLLIYFDTEFTGLQINTDLISIGCLADTGEIFYGQLNDYRMSKTNNKTQEFLKQNVIPNLFEDNFDALCSDLITLFSKNMKSSDIWVDVRQSKYVMGNEFRKWLKWLIEKKHPNYEKIVFVSDVAAYDTVVLFDLLVENATELPEYVVPNVVDINQIIAEWYASKIKTKTEFTSYIQDAFDLNREGMMREVLKKYNDGSIRSLGTGIETIVSTLVHYSSIYPEYFEEWIKKVKHNSLWDAIVIAIIYNYLRSWKKRLKEV